MIERYDTTDHAVWLANRDVQLIGLFRDGVALQLVTQPGKIPDALDTSRDIALHTGDRVAGIRHLDCKQLFRSRGYRVGKVAQVSGALGNRKRCPALLSMLRSLNGTFHVRLRSTRDSPDRFLSGGVDRVNPATSALLQPAADQHAANNG